MRGEMSVVSLESVDFTLFSVAIAGKGGKRKEQDISTTNTTMEIIVTTAQ
jgi:hypothetical protein